MTRRKSGGLSREGSKARRLQDALLKQIEIHREEDTIPTSLRFLTYELEQLGVIPKSKPENRTREPRQDLTDALTHLREIGLVGWDEIDDERREYVEWKYDDSIAEFVEDAVGRARIDPWGGNPPPTIICETEAVYGALKETARRYCCPITHTSGQARGHLITRVAPRLRKNQRIEYVGDYNLAGSQIEEHTRKTVIEYSRFAGPRVRGVQVRRNWHRLALTKEQVDADPRLLELVIRTVDRRYKPPRAYESVEAEAMGQRALVDLLTARLDELMPEMTGEPIEDVLVREKQQREQVAEQLRRLTGDVS
jgi:hypothetical protein